MTPVAAVQTMGIDCPVDLHIEEEDEIDNHELSLGARFLMGMVFGSLLFGFVSGLLLASGSQGLLPQNGMPTLWHHHGRSLPSGNQSWRCQSVEDLEQDCGSTCSSHPVVDLISIHKGYGHVRTRVY